MPNDTGIWSRILRDDVAKAALAGLTAAPKTLPPWLFYDDEGCRLFYEITKLPEYYLTRTEESILATKAIDMVPDSVRRAALVEFGASSEHKARHLLDLSDATGQPIFQTFVAIDVAAPALTEMQKRLQHSHPHLNVVPVVADFMRPLRLPEVPAPRMGFFPGSTIGNLDPDAAVAFLSRAHASLGPRGWMLLGADLRKDPHILLPAYNDPTGVTAAFNLNLLTRLNREAAADFDVSLFHHQAVWNDRLSRIEMHLISEVEQTVYVAGRAVTFQRGETIHTENSYKHPAAAVSAFGRDAGWQQDGFWTDSKGWFGIFLFRRG